jgi:hypothetical protein
VARCAFTVTDLHRLPSAGLPAHPSTASIIELHMVPTDCIWIPPPKVEVDK